MPLPPAGRGRSCAPVGQAPPARAPCAPTRASEGTASPVHLSPRLTCCFSGAEANPSRRQRGKRMRSARTSSCCLQTLSPPGGANVGWDEPLISSLTCTLPYPQKAGLFGGEGARVISLPTPETSLYKAPNRTPELTSQCAFVQRKQPI